MLKVADALSLILGDVQPLPPGPLPLQDSLGCVLARDELASFDLPPFPNSAVDGFAVRSASLAAASASAPVVLSVLGEARAGAPPLSFPEGPGCIRQMTGAPVPAGADAIVMKEDVTVGGDGSVSFVSPPVPGDHVRPAGQDLRRGDRAVKAGSVIRASEIAMLACLGLDEVPAFPRPHVAIFTTGDEVVAPGMPIGPGQIYNSNGPMLTALCRTAGYPPSRISHLEDDLERTTAAFEAAAADHDVIVSSGGVSVGEHDHVRAALERLGTVRFWRVAMKPGKPLVYGRIGSCFFFGLPGNPVSSMVSFELFVRPALLRLAGREQIHRPVVRARLLGPISHRPGREEYARVMTTWKGDEFVVHPHPGQDSHLVSSLVAANSLAVIPAEAGSLTEGARVDVMMTEWAEE